MERHPSALRRIAGRVSRSSRQISEESNPIRVKASGGASFERIRSRISEIILALVYVGLVGFILDRIVAAAATIVTRGTAAN